MEADCSLVGGETAILPDFYAARRLRHGRLLRRRRRARPHHQRPAHIQPGDVVLGLASTGLHSNGYSLARKIVFDHARAEGRRPRAGAGPDGRRGAAGRRRGSTCRPSRGCCGTTRSRRGWSAGWPTSPAAGCVDNVPRILPPGRRVFIRRGRLGRAAGLPLAAAARERRPGRRWTASSTWASAS